MALEFRNESGSGRADIKHSEERFSTFPMPCPSSVHEIIIRFPELGKEIVVRRGKCLPFMETLSSDCVVEIPYPEVPDVLERFNS